MAQYDPDSDDHNPANSAVQVDRVCDAFEAAWKAGQRPRIEDDLGEVPEPSRVALFRHLLALELDYRQTAGEMPEPGHYRERFPDYLAAVADAFPTIDSCSAIYRRPAPADRPVPSPRALHIRCPHCHNPVEVVDADPLTDICRLHFRGRTAMQFRRNIACNRLRFLSHVHDRSNFLLNSRGIGGHDGFGRSLCGLDRNFVNC